MKPERRERSIDVASLFNDATIVTGAHYSMTSAIGNIIAEAKSVHLVHEPFNPEPTLGYATIGTSRWYEDVDPQSLSDVAHDLADIANGRLPPAELRRRTKAVRSGHDLLRIGKLIRDHAARRRRPGRTVFKDPFMVFAASSFQADFETSIVLCVRHPCAFAESVGRRANGFDLRSLTTPRLLGKLGPDAALVEQAAAQELSPLEEAGVLWRVVYGFAARSFVGHRRTLVIRQEDVAADPGRVVQEVYDFLDLTLPRPSAVIAAEYTSGPKQILGRRSHVHRDADVAATQWKERLSRTQQQSVLWRAGDVAAMFGYQT